MTALFKYPDSAKFGRVIPKSKIYKHTKISSKQKKQFVQQLEQISWKYKLAPETINIPAGVQIRELQIFQLTLRTAQLDLAVLRLIDKAIPYPILFELIYDERIRLMAAHKRPNESDSSKWVLSKQYFGSNWQALDVSRQPLPVALHLDALYEKLLTPLVPVSAVAQEDLLSQVQRAEQIHTQKREMNKLQQRLQREKQFNKKVELNQKLRAAKEVLVELQHPQQSLINSKEQTSKTHGKNETALT